MDRKSGYLYQTPERSEEGSLISGLHSGSFQRSPSAPSSNNVISITRPSTRCLDYFLGLESPRPSGAKSFKDSVR